MAKTIYDLTKDEWNTLFPIELTDHNPEWKNIFQLEKEKIIKNISADVVLEIEHFGSTSIPNIKAKPYIDIIIALPKELLFNEEVISSFSAIGYFYFKVPEREGIEAYMSFGKGYNLEGGKEQVVHIHACSKDNYMWQQLAFRDYLIANTDRAKSYEQLKIDMASKFRNDRGAYVLSKTDFINETLELINN